MAINVQTFRTRSFTALLFVIIMGIGLLWNQWSFLVLFSIIHFGCWMEYQQLVGLIDPPYRQITAFHKYGVMIAGWCLLLFFLDGRFSVYGFAFSEIGWWLGLMFLFVLPIIELLFESNIRLKNIFHSIFGLVYISLSWALMMVLYQFPGIKVGGWTVPTLPLLLILSIWINDTMAYVCGSFIGKTPLSRISPKKTWEGTVSGIILSVALVGSLAAWLIDDQLAFASYHWYIISAITAITGTFGDLLESKLKRLAGVKDSGRIMPGHGGFLDRFDSMLLAIPFVWLYAVLLM